jgi:hypothetical protein
MNETHHHHDPPDFNRVSAFGIMLNALFIVIETVVRDFRAFPGPACRCWAQFWRCSDPAACLGRQRACSNSLNSKTNLWVAHVDHSSFPGQFDSVATCHGRNRLGIDRTVFQSDGGGQLLCACSRSFGRLHAYGVHHQSVHPACERVNGSYSLWKGKDNVVAAGVFLRRSERIAGFCRRFRSPCVRRHNPENCIIRFIVHRRCRHAVPGKTGHEGRTFTLGLLEYPRRRQLVCRQFVDCRAADHGDRFLFRDGGDFRRLLSCPVDGSRLRHAPVPTAVATAAAMLAATALTGFAGNALHGGFDAVMAIPYGVVAIIGGLIGSKIELKTKPKSLKTISGILTIIVAIAMSANALSGRGF